MAVTSFSGKDKLAYTSFHSCSFSHPAFFANSINPFRNLKFYYLLVCRSNLSIDLQA